MCSILNDFDKYEAYKTKYESNQVSIGNKIQVLESNASKINNILTPPLAQPLQGPTQSYSTHTSLESPHQKHTSNYSRLNFVGYEDENKLLYQITKFSSTLPLKFPL